MLFIWIYLKIQKIVQYGTNITENVFNFGNTNPRRTETKIAILEIHVHPHSTRCKVNKHLSIFSFHFIQATSDSNNIFHICLPMTSAIRVSTLISNPEKQFRVFKSFQEPPLETQEPESSSRNGANFFYDRGQR